jgi:outer membrane protein W
MGIGMPLKPSAFNDLWNASFPISLGLSYVIIPHVEVKGWATYASWSISEIPAKDAIGLGGVTEISGGTITTLLYGGSAKIVPFPKSRIIPYVEVGGGYFQASGEDLTVTHEGQTDLDNSMPDASGPVFTTVLGMEYGFNERWNVYAEIDYYAGFSSDFAPGDLVLGPDEPPTEGGDLNIATVVLGLILKI